MNTIAMIQDEPTQLDLLRAYRHTCWLLLVWVFFQIILMLIAPLIGEILGLAIGQLRPFIALAALALILIDIALVHPAQARLLTLGAKLQEEFDCAVLAMPWNPFAAGDKVDRAYLESAATNLTFVGWEDEAMNDRYAPELSRAPLHLARLVGQRTNLWYDGGVRRAYGHILLVISWVMLATSCVAGVVLGLNLVHFVVTVVVPASPIMTWAIREQRRQNETADQLDQIKTADLALWADARAGLLTEASGLARSRAFQDAIYRQREGTPFLVGIIYRLTRVQSDADKNANARRHLRELGVELDAKA